MLKKLIQNSSSNVLVFILKLAITLIMTPVFVSNLGDYDYGIREIVVSVIGYMGLLDMGLLPTMSRFAARYNAKNERDKLLGVYATSAIFLSIVGVLIGIGFVVWATIFPSALAESGEYEQKYLIFLLIVGAQLMVTFPGFVAESFLEGLQQYHLKNKIVIFNSIVSSIIMFIYITPENALLLIAAVNAIGVISKYIIFFTLLSKPQCGSLRLKFDYFSYSVLKELLIFGFKSFVQGASSRISYNVDNFVIAAFMGPAYIVFFAIPSALVRNIKLLVWNITHAFLPLFSHLSAQGDKAAILKYYINASRYIVAIVMLSGLMAAMLGPQFISLWIGERYKDAGALVFYILILFTLVPLLNPFSQRYLIAIGKHTIFAKLEPISAATNIILSILLVADYGLVGIALGSLIPTAAVHFVYLLHTSRCLELPVMSYVRQCWLPSVLPAAISVLSVLGLQHFHAIDSYFWLFSAAILGTVMFFVVFLIFANQEDKQSINTLYLKIKSARSK